MACLVSHAGALGDFLTTLPAMRVWRRLHPDGPMVLLGKPAHAALCTRLFDGALDIGSARLASLFGGVPDPGLAGELGRFEAALLFAPDSSALEESLRLLGIRRIVRQDPFPPIGGAAGGPVHVVDFHLSLFPPGVVTEDDLLPTIEIAPRPEDGEVSPRSAAIHPGSGSGLKNWPLDGFAALCRHLEGRGAAVSWVVGPAEADLAMPTGNPAWRGLTLPVLASRLARSALYVGNDSGVSHLAAAAGCPTLALFGATDPKVWAPRGRCVQVLGSAGRGMEGITVEEVVERADDLFRVRYAED